VVAGGPGTGKTTHRARILALLHEQAAAAGAPPPLVALAAPTGKAAARLQESVHEEAARLPVQSAVREQLLALDAVTLHRLLGWRFDSQTRFRHDRRNRLAYDVVVGRRDVDGLAVTHGPAGGSGAGRRAARAARRPGAAHVRRGGRGASATSSGRPPDTLRMSDGARLRLSAVVGHDVAAEDPPEGVVLGDGIVVLDRVRRYGAGVATVAEAIRRGDADATIAALEAGAEDVQWVAEDVAAPAGTGALDVLREGAVPAGLAVHEAAQAGDADAALEAQGRFRILCAHRRGRLRRVDVEHACRGLARGRAARLRREHAVARRRPVLITANDHELRLNNGDAGVAVAAGLSCSRRVRRAWRGW
jgi:exodeoxyribonuclease V alpha subunit